MKKYLPYLMLMALLLVLMGWYAVNDNQSTVDKREADFKVESADKITKVILQDDQKRTITLELKNGKWMVNEKYEARTDLVSQLLDVVTKIESQSPVSKAAHENVLREMLASNIRVQIFCNGKSKASKTYYVGGPTLDNRGTYMLMELNGKPASRPHIVVIPGREGYLTPVYEVEADVWRSRKVFDVSAENISRIEVSYPARPQHSFSITSVTADSFVLRNFKGETESVKQGILYAYLSMFQNIQIETFDNNNEERNMLLNGEALATIKLLERNGNTQLAKFYYMPINRRSKKQFDENGNEVKVDIDKLYISFNNDKDFGVAQMYVFGKLLRRFEDFAYAERNH